ncbi:hypothetical protein IEO21_08955 [Rhodonia placenta]|uniref:Uncharacterized protein n=1 Tax=Rhodonia placenta TaxID=104341 RepID=A0A8H7TYC2_9APHY|nr:hypothetical protein IEO21_08955 [Postia placenta]
MSQEPHIAVITGAAQGIGRAIALRLADDGIDVAVNDIPSNEKKLLEVVAEIQAKGRRSIPLIADVAVEGEVRAFVEKTVSDLGGIDIMVANAGIARNVQLIDMSVEDWDRMIAVNLRGVMLCYKYAAQQMIKQGRGGRILGASSFLGKKGAMTLSSYSATKFAIRGLTQSLALEVSKHNITVNAYCPGLIHTSMTFASTSGQSTDQHGNAVLAVPPSMPGAGPEVIASVVSYLVKPEAYFVTGQSIDVNGGHYMS